LCHTCDASLNSHSEHKVAHVMTRVPICLCDHCIINRNALHQVCLRAWLIFLLNFIEMRFIVTLKYYNQSLCTFFLFLLQSALNWQEHQKWVCNNNVPVQIVCSAGQGLLRLIWPDGITPSNVLTEPSVLPLSWLNTAVKRLLLCKCDFITTIPSI